MSTPNIRALFAPFPPDRVSWRVGSTTQDKKRGMALAYIDARDVMDRLDAILGPENWQCDYPHAEGKTVCRIGLKVGSEWVWKADGAGDTDYEAEKGALSDAFKRAAVRWGIGRYLYDVPAPWVGVEQKGKSYVILDSEMPKLQRVLHEAKPRSDFKTGHPAIQPEPDAAPSAAAENNEIMRQAIETGETSDHGDGVVTPDASMRRKYEEIRRDVDEYKRPETIEAMMMSPDTQAVLNAMPVDDRQELRAYAWSRIRSLREAAAAYQRARGA
jgi:hypothetical protein